MQKMSSAKPCQEQKNGKIEIKSRDLEAQQNTKFSKAMATYVPLRLREPFLSNESENNSEDMFRNVADGGRGRVSRTKCPY